MQKSRNIIILGLRLISWSMEPTEISTIDVNFWINSISRWDKKVNITLVLKLATIKFQCQILYHDRSHYVTMLSDLPTEVRFRVDPTVRNF